MCTSKIPTGTVQEMKIDTRIIEAIEYCTCMYLGWKRVKGGKMKETAKKGYCEKERVL